MGVYGGPNKVKGGIVFSLDGANPNSYAGDEPAPAGTDYGYFAGGGSGAPGALGVTTVDRIDFSNDTATLAAAGNLTEKQNFTAATGNQSYGYSGGGLSGPDTYPGTKMQRIDYSNDSAESVFKGNLTVRRQGHTATGNASYGYFIAGVNSDVPGPISTIDRIDYANDSATYTAKGPLPTAKSNTIATGNQSYGYSAAGEPAPAPAYRMTSVDRIDYSNDSATASPKGDLHRWGSKGAATGNADYGWFALGESPSTSTYVTRIDYGNDTATSSPKGPLNVAKKLMGATGNTSYGYWSSGAPQPINTKVSRVDYSNDTATAVDKGPMTAGRYGLGGMSSRANANPSTSGTQTRGDKWYDTSGRGNNATITDSRFRATDRGYFTFDGTGDYLTVPSTNDFAFGTEDFTVEYWVKTPTQGTDYGYFVGGSYPPVSTVDRIDYSNDTTTT